MKLSKTSERTETLVCYNSFSYLADKSTFLADVTVDMKTIQSRIEKKKKKILTIIKKAQDPAD